MINGVTQIVMTKADVLDAFEELVYLHCIQNKWKRNEQIPFQMTWNKIEPLYQNFKGWNTDITAMKRHGELPTEMKEYISFINKYLGVPVKYISNGPGRDQINKDYIVILLKFISLKIWLFKNFE